MHSTDSFCQPYLHHNANSVLNSAESFVSVVCTITAMVTLMSAPLFDPYNRSNQKDTSGDGSYTELRQRIDALEYGRRECDSRCETLKRVNDELERGRRDCDSRGETLKRRNEDLALENAKLTRKSALDAKRNVELSAKGNELDAEITTLTQQNANLTTSITQLDFTAARLKKTNDELLATVNTQAGEMAQLVQVLRSDAHGVSCCTGIVLWYHFVNNDLTNVKRDLKGRLTELTEKHNNLTTVVAINELKMANLSDHNTILATNNAKIRSRLAMQERKGLRKSSAIVATYGRLFDTKKKYERLHENHQQLNEMYKRLIEEKTKIELDLKRSEEERERVMLIVYIVFGGTCVLLLMLLLLRSDMLVRTVTVADGLAGSPLRWLAGRLPAGTAARFLGRPTLDLCCVTMGDLKTTWCRDTVLPRLRAVTGRTALGTAYFKILSHEELGQLPSAKAYLLCFDVKHPRNMILEGPGDGIVRRLVLQTVRRAAHVMFVSHDHSSREAAADTLYNPALAQTRSDPDLAPLAAAGHYLTYFNDLSDTQYRHVAAWLEASVPRPEGGERAAQPGPDNV